ncbi:MAG: hypothetical protein A4E69_00934 [Syntrophus sp. PtaB.Bin138]|nr:MAG: hypothetical protein A4E69_00934 [Syntrophus sp. PtaB.Bin138]
MDRRIGEEKRRQHEDDGYGGRHFSEKGPCPAAAEDGLAGTAECRPHTGAFSRLKKHDDHKDKTGDDMQYINQNVHSNSASFNFIEPPAGTKRTCVHKQRRSAVYHRCQKNSILFQEGSRYNPRFFSPVEAGALQENRDLIPADNRIFLHFLLLRGFHYGL